MLDILYAQGGWSKRASFGWLPSSYMRTMPSYYKGVSPIIDHDHGNPPGILKHSEVKPVLPPVEVWQLIDPGAKVNENRSLNVDADSEDFAKETAEDNAVEDARLKNDCQRFGVGTPQCPRPPVVKKLCDPREHIENMDAWYNTQEHKDAGDNRYAHESDCASVCSEKPWCVHYKFKDENSGSCLMWDRMPEECSQLRHQLHKATKKFQGQKDKKKKQINKRVGAAATPPNKHRQAHGQRHKQIQGRRRQHGHQLHPFVQE